MGGDETKGAKRRTINVSDVDKTIRRIIDEDREKLRNEIKNIIDGRMTEFENNISLKILDLENIIEEKSSKIDTLEQQISDLVTLNQAQGAEIVLLRGDVDELKSSSTELLSNSENFKSLQLSLKTFIRSKRGWKKELTGKCGKR